MFASREGSMLSLQVVSRRSKAERYGLLTFMRVASGVTVILAM